MDTHIPIYPQADDLVVLINSLDDVVGIASVGILYKFGENLGAKYADKVAMIKKENDERFQLMLSNLKSSAWFMDVIVKENDDANEPGTLVCVKDLFEEKADRAHCDFFRGFLKGAATEIYGQGLYCEQLKNRADCKEATSVFLLTEM